MSAAAPLSSIIVPVYDSQDYLDWVLATLVDYNGEAEVLVVNDGSKDDTTRMADEWALRYPGIVRTIHREDRGHGGMVNAGIGTVNGAHVYACDSDDQVDHPAMNCLFDLLHEERAAGRDLDLIITSYIYERQGRAHKTVVRYHNVLLQGKAITQKEVKPCRYNQYMMIYSLTMHTGVLRRSGLTLPEHVFYVDCLYLHTPLPLMRAIRYLDVDLYRYFIERGDQPTNEKVMISHLDQLLRVNREMVVTMPKPEEVPANLYRYVVHYLYINCVVTTVIAQLSGTPEHLEVKDQVWNELEATDPVASVAIELDLLARLACSRSRKFVTAAYSLVRAVMGFNRRLMGLGFHSITTTGRTFKEPNWRIGKA